MAGYLAEHPVFNENRQRSCRVAPSSDDSVQSAIVSVNAVSCLLNFTGYFTFFLLS